MPTYEYQCKECSRVFEEVKTISRRNEPADCPDCKKVAKRVMFTIPNALVRGEGTDSQRRKDAEDAKITRMANRARALKSSGEAPMDIPITMKDRRIQD